MKIIYFFIAIHFAVIGCRGGDGYVNPYSARMTKLGKEVEANPNDKTALKKLEEYTADSDYWNRSYALHYLGYLAFRNIGGCQAELIPYFDKALNDPDYGVRQAGIQAIVEIGSPAVEKSFSKILKIIKQDREDDVTWSSIEAVGKLKNVKQAQAVIPILLKAASLPPYEGAQDEAPQIRYYALDSIANLAKNNGLNVIHELKQLLNKTKSPFKDRVAKAINELEMPTHSIRGAKEK